ncbi:MAG TPA: hypothetical protein VII66_06160 [Gemmatimonadaceae bacterium]
MKKLLIPFLAAFGLSLGAATGIVIMRTPKAPSAAVAARTAGMPQKSEPAPAHKDTVAVSLAADSGRASTNGQPAAANVNTASPTGSIATAAANGNTGETGASATGHVTTAGQSAPSSKASLPAAPPASNTKVASSAPAIPKTPTPKPVSDSLIGRRLAQVFAAMQPKDAARVLEQMDDADVRSILGSLSAKQQAAILGSFPTARAALIVQATLRAASAGGAG